MFKRLKCHAIVVGINEYTNNRKLKNAVADAEAIARVLSDLKYDVSKLINATKDQFDEVIDSLSDKNYDVIVVYFAGHGMMYSKEDYIVFSDAAKMVMYDGTPASRKSRSISSIYKDIRQYLPDAMVIAIIDACREDLGEPSEEAEVERGLSHQYLKGWTKLPFQTFIAFATSPADTTGDGVKGHSKYTQSLLEEIRTLNQPIETTFKNVRRKVYHGHGDHLPWEYSCLVNEFAFNHGQCAPHYYSPYFPEGFSYSLESESFVNKLVIAKRLINEYLSTGNLGLFDPLMNVQPLPATDCFLIGRAIMHIVLQNQKMHEKIIHKDFLKPLIGTDRIDILNGIIYELYFDYLDIVRSRIEYPEIYQSIYNLFNTEHFEDTKKFISSEIMNKIGTDYYLPGSNTVAKFRIIFSENEWDTDFGQPIYTLDTIIFKGANCDFFNIIDKNIITYKEFRRELLKLSKSPGILLSVSANIDDIQPDDLIISGEISDYKVAEILEEEILNNSNSSLDELGHHYEFVEIGDVYINSIEQQFDDLSVCGTLTISAIVYLDNEEEIRFDYSIEGEFCISGYLSDFMREVKISFDTSKCF